MFAIRNLLRTNPQLVRNVIQQKNMSVISTPARNKISKGEMIFLSVAMVLGWSAVPTYVLVNIKKYRAEE